MHVTARARSERGSALIVSVIATVLMLALGLALLAIVDTQASESGKERTRDRAFNLTESVLTKQSFVIGRNWPGTAPAGNPACSAANAGFSGAIDDSAVGTAEVERLRSTLNTLYGSESAYDGSPWQVNVCDDGTPDTTVWSSSILSNPAWDADGDNKVWVRAQAKVGGRTRALTGLVQVRTKQAFDSRFGLVSGSLKDDLGSTVDSLATGALNGVLGQILNTTPTVAPDPTSATSGVTGLRCGLTDLTATPLSTCVSGTIAALGSLPLVKSLLVPKMETFPTNTTATPVDIAQLRTQAKAGGTYTAQSAGGTTGTTQACQLTGSPNQNSIVFIEKVGTGNEWCVLDVAVSKRYRAFVVGSGGVIVKGNGSATTVAASPNVNVFQGVVYGLNLQRHPVADGGMGLGDAVTPGREVIRITNGAHVKGGAYADGKSGRVGIYPPELVLSNSAMSNLIDSLVPCTTVLLVRDCTVRDTVKGVLTTLGVAGAVDSLIGIAGLEAVVNGLVAELNPQRSAYGSAIVSDVATVNAITVYGASGIVPGSFRDLAGR